MNRKNKKAYPFCGEAEVLFVQNIAVEFFAADSEVVGELPHERADVVMSAPLGLSDGHAEFLPINPILQPRIRRINTGVERFDIIKESFTDIRGCW